MVGAGALEVVADPAAVEAVVGAVVVEAAIEELTVVVGGALCLCPLPQPARTTATRAKTAATRPTAEQTSATNGG